MTKGRLVVRVGLIGMLLASASVYGLMRRDEGPSAVTFKESRQSPGIRLDTAFTGLESPVHLSSPPGDPRIFIVEQDGRVRLARGGQLVPGAWLDIRSRVGSGGERGLLSLAFHPEFRTNGRFYLYYTDRRGDLKISRFTAEPSSDRADPATETTVTTIRHPLFSNHNGGHLLFGPDGMLYAGTGDGGSGGDPRGNAQNPRSQLGKLLRLDVRNTPTVVTTWAIGLRNPWRIAFDSGLIYIADVGQNRWEEIDVASASDSGLNYGWRTMEGAHCFINPVCSRAGLVEPALEYDAGQGCSVIGGVVYRGRSAPQLVGHYVYSDYCGGWLRSFRYVNGAASESRSWNVPHLGAVSSFGVDGAGEVYVLTLGGVILRIASR